MSKGVEGDTGTPAPDATGTELTEPPAPGAPDASGTEAAEPPTPAAGDAETPDTPDTGDVEEKSPIEEKPKVLTPEERKKVTANYRDVVQGFLNETRKEDVDFAAAAKKAVASSEDNDVETEYHKIESSFTKGEPDEALADKPAILRGIFTQDKDKPIFYVRDPSGSGFYVVRITEVKEPRDLTIDEAREQIEEALSSTEALEAIETKLKDAREKLGGTTSDGPTFKAAAEKEGFEVKRVAYESFPRGDTGVDSSALMAAVGDTVPGQMSEVQVDAKKGTMLVYVAEKSTGDSEEAAARKKDAIAYRLRTAGGQRAGLVRSWLQSARAAADLKPRVIEELQRQ